MVSLESFVNFDELNMTTVLSSDFELDCEVVLMVVTIIGLQVNSVQPIMVTFLAHPHLGNAWFVQFAGNFVLNLGLYQFEVSVNFCVDFNDVVSHCLNIYCRSSSNPAFKAQLD